MKNKLLEKFPTNFRGEVSQNFCKFKIDIQFPKKFENVQCLGGDWGPSYKLGISPDDVLEVLINRGTSDDKINASKELKEITLQSPVQFKIRSKYVLYFDLPFQDEVDIRIYLDSELKIGKAELITRKKSETFLIL